ncbi:hypothetical protein [Rheinheimera sp.]|uniref:hypothetical protein n=1 Tax=Rheinheimera sp. TaxID=1869214 RepID=UPI002732D065|nr:hypothetical protein [Rheinheimera sp.]MDP2714441.1 hypothetical protein [Rheinheimera sp.]
MGKIKSGPIITFSKSSRKGVVDIATPEDLYAKLERTLHRRAAYGDDQFDWVFDFSITAWHMVDWLASRNGPADRKMLRTLQEQCRADSAELAVCEQIANGAKHKTLDNPLLAPFDLVSHLYYSGGHVGCGYVTAVEDHEDPPEFSAPGASDWVVTPAVNVIDRSGKDWDVLLLFLAVLYYWRKKLGVPPVHPEGTYLAVFRTSEDVVVGAV